MESKTAIGIVGGNSEYGRVKSDFYPTPPEATHALLNFLHLPKNCLIWEPACGDGHMVNAIRERGYECVGTDIRFGNDYLSDDTKIPNGTGFIATNPPFSKAEEFIRRSLEHGVPFVMLLKSQFWNAKRRYDLFYDSRPQFVLPLTWRPDFLMRTRGRGASLMDVQWTVWLLNGEDCKFQPLLKEQTE